ncbi:GDSL esterase/lipase [Panicum miliaceum]|uniref:GDSL esterase/lipase n=1 Tax=Panicum miliaceum TaxID=4540 RepID=A0A3L6TFB7_PANMI|nr:GDSL esterase/lipase [Panicum miliaceum]
MVGYRSALAAGTVLMCLLVVSSSLQVMMVAAAAGARPPAMFVFGDSTLDVGNNNYLPGRPFYGIDFPGAVATGRFSNGYNIADYLARSMGFRCSPPPYLSLAPSTGRLVQVAVGGGNAGNNIPLSKQVEYFRSTKSQMVAKLGTRAANLLLAKSVFLFSVGSKDLFVFAIAEKKQNKSAADLNSDVAALYASLVSGYSAAVQELHALGARKLAVINVGLLGYVPAARLDDAAGACSGALNQLASGFDDALASMLAGLASSRLRRPGFAYSLTDYYGLSAATFDDPRAVGYTDIAGACCGGGRLSAEAPCLPNATVCANRDQHAFWDAVHPSQRGAMLTAQNFYDSRPGRYTAPVNFKQLAHTSL